MSVPQPLYYALNRAFEAVRTAEKEAARLEHEAQEYRDRAHKQVQEAYDMLIRAKVELHSTDNKQ
jgi:hypothetical protein